LVNYIDNPELKVQAHIGTHNLVSSWILAANLYFPVKKSDSLKKLSLSFLQQYVSSKITELVNVELEFAFPKLPVRHVAMLWDCVDQLALAERQTDQAERTIDELVRGATFAADYALLVSFPGVAMVTAATVLAEVGDFRRFKDPKAIGRYAGLNPRVFASGGKQRVGAIAKTGSPHLRWILQQADWTAIRTDDGVKHIFLRIAKRSGRKAAAVAVARKLLTWMHSAVTKGEPYRTRAAA
jgi:transposase